MGLFDKQEKKLRKEFGKKNTNFCREGVKELEELHEELKEAYKTLDNIAEEFSAFKDLVAKSLNEEDNAKMEYFNKRFKKLDKVSRDAVRDVSDLLRNQKKRLREAMSDE
jgi:archaellum component FlaC